MDEKEKSINLNKEKIAITIAVLSVFVGLFLISRNYLLSKKEIAYENVAFEIYDNETLNNLDSIEKEEEEKEPGGENTPSGDSNENIESDNVQNPQPEEDKKQDKEESLKNKYIGTIEISKIKLKKGFVDPSSKYNNINYNVTIIKGFDYPDVKNGNFILAAHSGTGSLAYFKNLYKLAVGDKATITYKGKKYNYKIVKIYTQKKQGYLTIYRNVNKTTLTLITCTKDNKKLQTVYIAELI